MKGSGERFTMVQNYCHEALAFFAQWKQAFKSLAFFAGNRILPKSKLSSIHSLIYGLQWVKTVNFIVKRLLFFFIFNFFFTRDSLCLKLFRWLYP